MEILDERVYLFGEFLHYDQWKTKREVWGFKVIETKGSSVSFFVHSSGKYSWKDDG